MSIPVGGAVWGTTVGAWLPEKRAHIAKKGCKFTTAPREPIACFCPQPRGFPAAGLSIFKPPSLGGLG